ncbi:MAG TPA: tetratricopeptide repeat protein [Chloroflexi bacterium]|nr:tetratricopeptide repeat protein [Chloroflexota bacterium]
MIGRVFRRFGREGVWLRLIGAAVVVLALGIAPVPLSLTQAVGEGRAAAAAGEYARAADAFHRAVAYQPWESETLSAAAEMSLLAGDHGAAARDLERLARLRALQAEEIGWLGAAYTGLGRVDEAVSLWEDARAQGLVEPGSLAGLAEIYIARREWKQAGDVLANLARFAPGDAGLHYRLGLIQALDEPDWAVVALAQAVALDPSLAEPLADLRTVLDERPADPPDLAYTRLGIAYLRLEELPLAEEALSRAVAYNPAYGEALAYLAYVRARLDEPALGAAQQALALSPDSPAVLSLVGLTWKQLSRPIEARTAFEKAYALDPSNPAFAVEIAATHRAEHAYEWAEIWMQEAVRLAPDDPRFKILLAQFYVDEEYRVEEAGLPLAEELVAELPESAAAHEVLGWAYFLTGDVTAARRELEQALSLNPELARAHAHMGILLEEQGQIGAALEHYTTASELEPDGPFGELARRALDRILEGGG